MIFAARRGAAATKFVPRPNPLAAKNPRGERFKNADTRRFPVLKAPRFRIVVCRFWCILVGHPVPAVP